MKFGAGEHLLLGNRAYAEVCPSGCLNLLPLANSGEEKIPRKDGKEYFSYGELVAFSGDFFPTPASLDNSREARHIFDKIFNKNYKNVSKTKDLFANEVETIEEQITFEDSTEASEAPEVGDENLGYFTAFGWEYLEMSICNFDHFGWENMKRYVEFHSEALELALAANAEQDPGMKTETLRQALIANAFADHFLTDGFAAGHIRVPRKQGLTWQKVVCDKPAGETRDQEKARLAGNKQGKAVGAMAKFQHDNDHRFAAGSSGNKGLKVLNAKGQRWQTRSDGELYIAASQDDTAVRMPVHAVRLSILEVMNAYSRGVVPSGVYAAAELVPFIDPNEQPITQTFPADMSLEQVKARMNQNVSLLEKASRAISNVTPAFAQSYFAQGPQLMAQFRADVAADIRANPQLQKRLPVAYLNGYLNVQ
ncbi:MAG: hypothetical protein EOP10_18150 [Proteobacteria bacterium]|nr:MAG: hypothetical protein EOP10_18150 [Pseudomonadota bacterium]